MKQYVPKHANKGSPSKPANFVTYEPSPEAKFNSRKSSEQRSLRVTPTPETSKIKPHSPPKLDVERSKSQLEAFKDKVKEAHLRREAELKASQVLEGKEEKEERDKEGQADQADAKQSMFRLYTPLSPLSSGRQRRTREDRIGSSRNLLKSPPAEEQARDHVRVAAD